MNSTLAHSRGSARSRLWAPAVLTLFAASAAFAQSASDSDKKDDTVKLEKFTVTGSYIPQATSEPIAPVAIFTEADMRAQGATTVIQALRTLPSFVGNPGPTELDSNGGNGSTGVSLRGLGVSQTLVLIDGLPADQFGNIQLIPIEAVERVEVLRDGAAIIYGPGAIGGAVNIITKKHYNGSAVNVLAGGATRTPGSRETFQSSFVAGASNGPTSVVVSGSYFKNRTIYASQRPNTANSDGRPNGGTNGGSPTFAGRMQTADGNQWVLGSGQNAPNATGSNYIPMDTNIFSSNQLFNFRQYSPSAPGQERSSFMASLDHEIMGKKLELFGSVLYARLETTNGLAPSPFTLRNTGLAVGQLSSFGPYVPTTATGLGSAVRAVIYRSVEIGNRSQNQTFNDWRWNVGLKGEINDKWSWSASMTKYLETFVQVDGGVPSLPLLDAEVQAGRFNPFAQAFSTGTANGFTWDNARALNAALTHARQTTTIQSRYYDARISGSIVELPAGDLGFAGGWERNDGTNTFDPDGLYATGSVLGLNAFTSDFRSSASAAYFAEIKVPVFGEKNKLPFVNALDIGALARNDKLTVRGTNANTGLFDSRTYTKTNPSINLHWSPAADYLIRGTWSKGFNSPSSAQVFGAATTSNPTLNDPLGFPTLAQTAVIIRGNSNLGPVTSKGWSLGVVGSPKNLVKGLTFSVDFYHNTVDGIIAGNFKSILAANAAGQGAGFVPGNAATINPNAPFAAQIKRLANGQLDTSAQFAALPGFTGAVLSDNLNIGTREVSGLEYTVTYTFNTDNWGRFKWVTAANQFLKVDQTAGPGTPAVSYLGQFHSTTGDALSPGSIPRWKGNSGVTWMWKELTTNLTMNYVHHYQDDPLFVLSPALKAFYDSGATVANNPQYAAFLASPVQTNPRVGGIRDIKAFTTFDLQFAWAFKSDTVYLKGLTLTLGANNILDKLAPFSAGAFNDNYDTRTVNNIGRFVYFDLRKQF